MDETGVREAELQSAGKSFCEVLERQVFLFADLIPPGDFDAGEEEYYVASIRFFGEITGRVELALPHSLVSEIATNFLGLQESEPAHSPRARDACKELLNVTCGHILTTLRGSEPIFDLSIPEIQNANPDQVMEMTALPGALTFSVEDSRAAMRLVME